MLNAAISLATAIVEGWSDSAAPGAVAPVATKGAEGLKTPGCRLRTNVGYRSRHALFSVAPGEAWGPVRVPARSIANTRF